MSYVGLIQAARAVRLVDKALHQEQRQAEDNLSRAEAELRELDLRYEAHAGFAHALHAGHSAARLAFLQDVASQDVRNSIVDIIRLHKPILARDGIWTWSEFLDGIVESLLQPMTWTATFWLIRNLLSRVNHYKRDDDATRTSVGARRFHLLLCFAEARAQSRVANRTANSFIVMAMRLRF